MKAVWAKGLLHCKNLTLAFTLDLGRFGKGKIRLCAASCYRLWVDDKFVAFGPMRAAHGYARVSEYPFFGRRITVEVHSHYVKSYCYVKQTPFFACEVTSGGKTWDTETFLCRHMKDRIRKTPRYSYQRGFAEVYAVSENPTALLKGKSRFPVLETETVPLPVLLRTNTAYPVLRRHRPQKKAEKGSVITDETLPVWRDSVHTLEGGKLEGFLPDEWERSATDEASRFVYRKDGSGGMEYAVYDFGRAITGFLRVKVNAKSAGSVYLIYDELMKDTGKGGSPICFSRNGTSNVVKWELPCGGRFSLMTFEPYTARYVCAVFSKGTQIRPDIIDYENPDAQRMRFSCASPEVKTILEAARATFAQNAVDFLTDCPSRERAGWLSDSYFSSVAERLFTGENRVERAFLENYALSDCSHLPSGMIPMCYPADDYDGVFIPNWAMWYLLELDKYAKLYGKDGLVLRARAQAEGILAYFKRFENEYGLLEDAESWIFVEWSAANDGDRTCGVNVPTNFCYAACLAAMGKLYGVPAWEKHAEKVRTSIRELAFNGRLFVDNLVRRGGRLIRTEHFTEVCQYYAFWFDGVSKAEYPKTYAMLMEELGPNRKKGAYPEISPPNMMYGIYMRLDLLMREGKREQVLRECLYYFSDMANCTGTLWENNNISASCDHGFSSYAARWIVYALTGYDVLEPSKSPASEGIGIDCELLLPSASGGGLQIRVKNNILTQKRLG